ncbi:uncharacterized protein LOC107885770 [Acyrthosiphon pisum]|uniref:Uncharacterized protein n=1 Tax=Acyrthosiphon pisum TaxID=7029 RepID=A0A8R2H9Q4_ACYPI|nr:uncharacterized protein LOC107885770 [Acyrthosiphon pisum]
MKITTHFVERAANMCNNYSCIIDIEEYNIPEKNKFSRKMLYIIVFVTLITLCLTFKVIGKPTSGPNNELWDEIKQINLEIALIKHKIEDIENSELSSNVITSRDVNGWLAVKEGYSTVYSALENYFGKGKSNPNSIQASGSNWTDVTVHQEHNINKTVREIHHIYNSTVTIHNHYYNNNDSKVP